MKPMPHEFFDGVGDPKQTRNAKSLGFAKSSSAVLFAGSHVFSSACALFDLQGFLESLNFLGICFRVDGSPCWR